MSAERTRQTESSLVSRPLEWLVRLSIRFPVATLAIGVVAAVLSVVAGWRYLQFHTSRADLLNPRSEYHRRWLAYTQEFGDQEDVVVVVEGESPERIVPVVRELAGLIRQEDWLFEAVLDEIDVSKLRAKGLYYLEPAQLEALSQFLDQAEPVRRGDWSQFNLGTVLAQGMAMPRGGAARSSEAMQAQLGQLTATLEAALAEDEYRSRLPEIAAPASPGEAKPRRFLSEDGRLGFLLLRFKPDKTTSFARNSDAVDALREMAAETNGRHPETHVGVTGLPVMENDEMRSSDSSTQAAILSLLGVAIVYIAGFGGLRYPMTISTSLMLAVIWSLGFVVLAVGHLNILSSAFGAILIGLGDYGVHCVAQYLHLRQTNPSPRESLVEMARTIGPGITTAAFTMAGAFFAASLTDFKGVAELGIIAGGGCVLCWLADLTILPALICLIDREHGTFRPPAPLDFYVWLKPLASGRWVTLAGMVVVTLFLGLGVARLRYDYNLLHLQPTGLESVELQNKLLATTKRSAYYALSMADDPQEAVARRDAFAALPSVERVEEIASMFPGNTARKRPLVQAIHTRLDNLPDSVPSLPVLPPAQLDATLQQMQFFLSRQPGLEVQCGALGQLRQRLAAMSEGEYYQRMSRYQQAMAADVLGRLRQLQAASDPVPPQLSDLPEGLATRFVGRNGRYLLHVYCRGDIWDQPTVERFVADLRSVDADATGNPIQIYEASRQMNESYVRAACYSLIVVVGLLFLDFRSLGATLLASVPLLLGMLQLFGLMGVLDIPLNAANMIVLPLILGIGIDNGVHIVHDYHAQGINYRRISSATATAVVVNSLTTMVGFGSLMIASHQGLQSLGRVLTLGITTCLLTALVLPNLLMVLAARARKRQAASAAGEPSPPAYAEEAAPSVPPIPIVRRPAEDGAPAVHAADDHELRPAA